MSMLCWREKYNELKVGSQSIWGTSASSSSSPPERPMLPGSRVRWTKHGLQKHRKADVNAAGFAFSIAFSGDPNLGKICWQRSDFSTNISQDKKMCTMQTALFFFLHNKRTKQRSLNSHCLCVTE